MLLAEMNDVAAAEMNGKRKCAISSSVVRAGPRRRVAPLN
jgi:hypothetical protein